MRAANGRRERGFTLVEVMAVVVLAAVIGFGLIGFYLNSQATWLDASSQALAQRDGTLILETITDRARPWARAEIMPVDSTNDRVLVRDALNAEKERFYWDPSDSLVHHASNGAASGPAITDTRVVRFSASVDSTGRMVLIDSLHVLSATGQRIRFSSSFTLYNYVAP